MRRSDATTFLQLDETASSLVGALMTAREIAQQTASEAFLPAIGAALYAAKRHGQADQDPSLHNQALWGRFDARLLRPRR
jgi:hypothetical protein